MPFYKVTNVYQYTATAYVEADSLTDAVKISQEHEMVNSDDRLYDYNITVIEQDEFDENVV